MPAPTPHVFGDLPELHRALREASVQHSLEAFRAQRVAGVREAVEASVAGNTFRAFRFRTHALSLAPSTLYRDWTTQRLAADLGQIVALAGLESMIDYVTGIAAQLDAHWYACTGVEQVRIGFGRAAKLLNLSIKHLLWLPRLTDAQRDRLVPMLNVPLDSFTLQGLRRVAPDLAIPAGATMKWIRDPGHYRAVQLRIAELMPPGISPMHYEIAGWNLAHP